MISYIEKAQVAVSSSKQAFLIKLTSPDSKEAGLLAVMSVSLPSVLLVTNISRKI
jgi:hypothetical protein